MLVVAVFYNETKGDCIFFRITNLLFALLFVPLHVAKAVEAEANLAQKHDWQWLDGNGDMLQKQQNHIVVHC